MASVCNIVQKVYDNTTKLEIMDIIIDVIDRIFESLFMRNNQALLLFFKDWEAFGTEQPNIDHIIEVEHPPCPWPCSCSSLSRRPRASAGASSSPQPSWTPINKSRTDCYSPDLWKPYSSSNAARFLFIILTRYI